MSRVLPYVDKAAVFVVTGASGGIGSEFVRQLVKRSQGTVIAASRTGNLPSGVSASSNVVPLALDVGDQESVDAFGLSVKDVGGGRVDALFNVAGELGLPGKVGAGPERALKEIRRDWLLHSFNVNAAGAVMVCQAVEPLVRATAKLDGCCPVAVNLSARVGSIGDNKLGGWWSYRMSKAALNMATVCMSHEWRRFGGRVIAIHPGTVDTGLSKPFNVKPSKLFTQSQSIGMMLDVVDGLQDEDSGKLFDYSGAVIPW